MLARKRLKVIGFIILCVNIHLTNSKNSSRQKRYLIFPRNGSKIQLILGVGVPVPLDEYSITVGWVVKAPFVIPDNATLYTQPYVAYLKRSPEHRASRYSFYKMFEDYLDRRGADGKGCLLRSICETARTPFLASGSVGRIIHTFLTPSSTSESARSNKDQEYVGAELLGKTEGATCHVLYPECKINIFDIISGIDHF